MRALRLALTGSIAFVSACAVGFDAAQPRNKGEERDWDRALEDAGHGTWLDCDAPERVEMTLQAISDRLHDSANRSFKDPAGVEPALDGFLITLGGWLRDDSAPIFEHFAQDNLVFSRKRALDTVRTAVTWTFLDEHDEGWYAEVDDRAVFAEMLVAQRASGLRIAAIDADSVRVGKGVTLVMATEEWPHSGMFSSLSVFDGPAGPREDYEALEDTDATCHALFRIRLEDGRIGHLALCALFDDRTNTWVPIGGATAIYNHASCPWPFVN